MDTDTPPPDVSAIQKFDGSELNEVNDRIKDYGWVLLGILVTRNVSKSGSFADKETYILGSRRKLQ
jgi:hypothetical protein